MSAEHATPDHPGDVEDETHGIGDHGEDHGHESEALGPLDTQAWGAFALGIGLGLAIVASIVVSIGGLPG